MAQNDTENELQTILRQLTPLQIEFVIARSDVDTDREAAKIAGVTESTVRSSWCRNGTKPLIDRAVQLMKYDGVITAMELRRRNLARAMAVKVAGLESRNERVRQACATEIIEGMLGKAEQVNRVEGRVELIWHPHKPTGES